MKKFAGRALATLIGSVVSFAAFAQAIDVDDVTDNIAAQLVPLAAIGGGVLLVFVAIKAWKWGRRAL